MRVFVNTGKIQMAPTKERFADLLINNKTIIEFGSRRNEELLRPRFVLSASASDFGR